MNLMINGLGRIGRHIFRLAIENKLNVRTVNEPFASTKQIKLLLQHDSVYGNFLENLNFDENNLILPENKNIKVYHDEDIANINFQDIDILIESSGKIKVNVLRDLVNKYPKLKVLITCDGKQGIDQKIVYGVNHDEYKIDSRIISTMTCDATAISPVLKALSEFGLESASVISLHPYLPGQQLLDNAPRYPNPNADLSLWRSSIDNLIPKETSAAKVCMQILPELTGKIISFQLRVPTSCVTGAFIDVELNKSVTKEEVLKSFNNPGILKINEDLLVSRDFAGDSNSAIIDMSRFIVDGNKIKILIWYDNEYGYCSRVIDMINLVATKND